MDHVLRVCLAMGSTGQIHFGGHMHILPEVIRFFERKTCGNTIQNVEGNSDEATI